VTLRQVQGEIVVQTSGRGLVEVTDEVAGWLAGQGVSAGQLTVFIRHIVPEDRSLYRHSAEGPDDMPAHIRSALTQVQVAIPVAGGRLALGTWQGIYVFEHRARPHRRRLLLQLIGE
jgi:thiamine phosphate synthase YjbQ (UPF0047 family)